MDVSVVVAAREEDRPGEETLRLAALADRLGYGELWAGEGPAWDAFALAAAIGTATRQARLTAGPLPVSVRDPATIARGAASVAALSGRPVGVALGTSSPRVVTGLHGRSRAGAVRQLADSAGALRGLLGGPGMPEPPAEMVPGSGFPRHLPPAGGPLTVAAFGERAIAAAATHADRMVLDLVSPDQVGWLRAKLNTAAVRAGRTRPRLVAWLPTAVDPAPESATQILAGIAGYLAVPGYAEMFVAAGFGHAVRRAREGAGAAELLAELPPEAAHTVGLVGDPASVRARMREYATAGLDEVALVPATHGDPDGARTLTALAR